MNRKCAFAAAVLLAAVFSGVFAQSAETGTDVSGAVAVAQTAGAAENSAPAETEAAAVTEKNTSMIRYIAAALAVGLACLAGGMAVGKIGAAAMGAMSENQELSGKALPFVGLAEGICLWGFLVALLIIIL